MKESAGIVIRLNHKKLLLCRPTNKTWRLKSGATDTLWGPPKGGIDPGETIADAAIRETFEEIGIKIDPSKIIDRKPILINYGNKSGSVYKKVYLFVVDIESISQIGLESESVPTSFLQEEEIDMAYFMEKKEASKKLFHRFSHLTDLI